MLMVRDRILLADDMGLGKTIQAIAAIRILCLQRTIQPILLVVSSSLIDQWRRELHRWAPELRLIVVRGLAKDRAWQGIDLIETKVDAIGADQTIYVQCKDHVRPVGVEVVREFIGVLPVGKNIQPILASPTGVTADAGRLAKQRGVRIWDESTLSRLELN